MKLRMYCGRVSRRAGMVGRRR